MTSCVPRSDYSERRYQMDAMFSAEEILCSTQQVIAGLEALRGENCSLLKNLQEPEESLQTLEHSSVKQEKCSILRQSLERIELGLSEAQVPSAIMCIIKTSPIPCLFTGNV